MSEHYEREDRHPGGPKHVVIDVPPGGKETAVEVIEYRVGPRINYAYFRTWRGQPRLLLWGEQLSESMLHRLSEACHDVEREHADMAMYDAAKAADRMEGAFLYDTRQQRFGFPGGGRDE